MFRDEKPSFGAVIKYKEISSSKQHGEHPQNEQMLVLTVNNSATSREKRAYLRLSPRKWFI